MNRMRLYVGTLFMLALFVLIPAGLGLSKQAAAQDSEPLTLDYLAAGEWGGNWYLSGGGGLVNVEFNDDMASYNLTDYRKRYRWNAKFIIIKGDKIVITSIDGRVDTLQFRRKGDREELKGTFQPRRGPRGSITLKRAIPPPAASNEIRENVVFKPQPKTEWPTFQSILKPGKSRSSVRATFPGDMEIIVPSEDTPTNQVSFSGVWQGWMCARRASDTKLAVEQIVDGKAIVVYAHAGDRAGQSTRGRIEANFINGELVGTMPNGVVLTYALRKDGHLNIKYWQNTEWWCTGILSKS